MNKAGPTCVLVLVCLIAGVSEAQNRGVYPLGMSATNSGVTPEAGFTYSNLFILYTRDESRGPDGELIATGSNSVLMDMNTFIWVCENTVLGAKFSFSATLPIANNSLTSDEQGTISGGGGFADSFYQPFILGWQRKRMHIRMIYGFLAPTGRFQSGASDNVGSGYWTHVLSSGQTFYLTKDKKNAFSAFQMYEFHTEQKETQIHPGETLNLDYSLTHIFSLNHTMQFQTGLAGYGQWQTTDRKGPGITPEQETAHYKINALGFAANLMLPERSITLGLKYFHEFSNRSTFQGNSLQISATIGF